MGTIRSVIYHRSPVKENAAAPSAFPAGGSPVKAEVESYYRADAESCMNFEGEDHAAYTVGVAYGLPCDLSLRSGYKFSDLVLTKFENMEGPRNTIGEATAGDPTSKSELEEDSLEFSMNGNLRADRDGGQVPVPAFFIHTNSLPKKVQELKTSHQKKIYCLLYSILLLYDDNTII